jgi:hypothetical protein
VEDPERTTFTVEAKQNPAVAPLQMATIAMKKGNRKMIYYKGYEAEDSFELYDLDADLEELEDLYPAQPSFAKSMREELLDSLADADRPYTK